MAHVPDEIKIKLFADVEHKTKFVSIVLNQTLSGALSSTAKDCQAARNQDVTSTFSFAVSPLLTKQQQSQRAIAKLRKTQRLVVASRLHTCAILRPLPGRVRRRSQEGAGNDGRASRQPSSSLLSLLLLSLLTSCTLAIFCF